MKINTVDNQSFSGKTIVLNHSPRRKELVKIARELDKANFVKKADCNFYLEYGYDFSAKGSVVKVFGKSKKYFNEKTSKTENATVSLGAIFSAIKRAYKSYKNA